MGTGLELVDVEVVAANGMHYSVVVLMVVGDNYFHGVVLDAQNFHGVREDGMVQQEVEAAVVVELLDLNALHT